MKTPNPLDAALAWNALGLQWLDMMSASGAAIARRTRRQPSPTQLFHMGSEKVEAALESSAAMGRAMSSFPAGDPLAMWGAWARILSSGVAPFHARAKRNARVRRAR